MKALDFFLTNAVIMTQHFDRQLVLGKVKELTQDGWTRDKNRDISDERKSVLAMTKGLECIWLGKWSDSGTEKNYIDTETEADVKSNTAYLRRSYLQFEKLERIRELKKEKRRYNI